MDTRSRSTAKVVTSVTSDGVTHVRTTSMVCEDGDCSTEERVERIEHDDEVDRGGRHVVKNVVRSSVHQVSRTSVNG